MTSASPPSTATFGGSGASAADRPGPAVVPAAPAYEIPPHQSDADSEPESSSGSIIAVFVPEAVPSSSDVLSNF